MLVGRGFSLATVGIAEGVFHVVSMLFEVPSGMLADLMGRRRTLIAAGLVSAAAGVAMAASCGLVGVCAAMALEALSFNLASGTLEALTYDTLAEAGQKSRYIQQTSRQYTLYSVTQSAASLMSVVTIRLGFVTAYLLSACVGLGCAALGGLLTEPDISAQARPRVPLRQLPRRLAEHALENVRFLLHRRRLAARMLCISLVCAAAYLTQMFWQQGLVDAGLPAALVGVPLFLLMLADVPGALLAPRLPARLGSLFLGCGLAVSACTMLAGSACLPLWSGRGSGCRASGKCIYSAGRQLDAAVLPQRQPRNFDQRGQHDVQHLHGGALPAGRRRRKRMGGGALHFSDRCRADVGHQRRRAFAFTGKEKASCTLNWFHFLCASGPCFCAISPRSGSIMPPL